MPCAKLLGVSPPSLEQPPSVAAAVSPINVTPQNLIIASLYTLLTQLADIGKVLPGVSAVGPKLPDTESTYSLSSPPPRQLLKLDPQPTALQVGRQVVVSNLAETAREVTLVAAGPCPG